MEPGAKVVFGRYAALTCPNDQLLDGALSAAPPVINDDVNWTSVPAETVNKKLYCLNAANWLTFYMRR